MSDQIEQIINDAFGDARRIIRYGEDLWRNSSSIFPRMHQIIRIHEAVENGHKRILCADGTSGGHQLPP